MSKTNRAKSRDIRRVQKVLNLSYTEAKASLESSAFIRKGWSRYGWHRLLPNEAMSLELTISTADLFEKPGTLNELFSRFEFTESTETLLTWPDGESGDDSTDGPRKGARSAFEYALKVAGYAQPSTLGELADILAKLGVYHHEIDANGKHYWSLGDAARTIEVLSLPQEWISIEEEAWWRTVSLKPAIYLSEWLVHKGFSSRSKLSISRASESTGMSEEDVKDALDGLIYKDRAVLWRGSQSLSRADVQNLEVNSCFEIEVKEIEPDEAGNEELPDDWDDLGLETIQWSESPWRICLVAAGSIGLSEGPGQILAELPFKFSVKKGSVDATSIAEMAAGVATTPAAAARSLMELERFGALRWNSQRQVAEFAQHSRFRPASDGRQ